MKKAINIIMIALIALSVCMTTTQATEVPTFAQPLSKYECKTVDGVRMCRDCRRNHWCTPWVKSKKQPGYRQS